MKDVEFKILTNEPLTGDIFRMTLDGDTSDIRRPGQFVEIAIPGRYLRRPISVCDWSDNRLTLIYKVVGEGTEDLSYMEPGDYISALTGLGNGYDLKKIPKNPVIAGGGVGVPPMYALAKELKKTGITPYVALGFNTKDDVFYEAEFKALGVPVNVATVDGSYGAKGFVTDIIGDHDYALCCGPEPMLKAVYDVVKDGQFSFEARMGCGFGACMGCSKKTKTGFKRVCKDGPIFMMEEIAW
ncbi:MAG: dihydroorotate dehydrogenase electron transfer subunit [Lachnospiraceae bacterium]|nr:dihydroorotate dehydrogenase electron transfer subunit [Lachnospiraceae bacterium]